MKVDNFSSELSLSVTQVFPWVVFPPPFFCGGLWWTELEEEMRGKRRRSLCVYVCVFASGYFRQHQLHP